MTAKGYADMGQVERWYGTTLTGGQAGYASLWREAAEQAIDRATGRTWLTGAITGERHSSSGPRLWLRIVPVTSVEAVVAYGRYSSTPIPLPVTTGYWLEDAGRGQLYVLAHRHWETIAVDYTPAATVPATIQEATAALLADWLASSESGSSSGGAVVAEKVGDVEVRYAAPDAGAAAAASALPPRVLQLLAPYLRAVVFA